MRVDAVVVGGGLAGLTAAVGLSRHGLEVVVVEREETLGGRARSWIDPVTGDPVHIGPHIFLDEYPNMWALLDAIGSEGRITWQEDGLFVTLVDGRKTIEIRDSGLMPPAHFLPSLLEAPGVSFADVLSCWSVTSTAMRMGEADVLRLDRENAASFLLRRGVTRSFVDWYWRFAALAIMNVPLELCSAGALMRFYQFQVTHGGVRVGFANTGLGDVFAPQARRAIEEAGGTVLLGTEVRGIAGHGRAATGVRLADGRLIEARHVAATVPPMALLPLLPAEWRREFAYLSSFQPVPYVSVYLWFDRRLTDRTFWARTFDPGDLNCDFYDLRSLYGGGGGSLICSNIIWSHRCEHLDDEEVVAVTVRELAEFLPEAAAARVERAVVSRIPMAIHAPFPGTERSRPPTRTAIDGLVLAGDWIATGFPSSMEGAVRAGWLAAEAILEARGRPVSLARTHRPPEGLARLYQRLPRAATSFGPGLALRALGALREGIPEDPPRQR